MLFHPGKGSSSREKKRFGKTFASVTSDFRGIKITCAKQHVTFANSKETVPRARKHDMNGSCIHDSLQGPASIPMCVCICAILCIYIYIHIIYIYACEREIYIYIHIVCIYTYTYIYNYQKIYTYIVKTGDRTGKPEKQGILR